MNKLIINNNCYIVSKCNKIGEGKHSSVYLCECENSNNYVIKFSKQIKYDFNKEYSYSFCSMNNYIKGIGKYNDITVLVMEPINGLSLDKILKIINSKNLQLGINFYIDNYNKINNIIDEMHKYYIFHNDIIPQNIYINDDNYKIIDFGESFNYYNRELVLPYYYDDLHKENIIYKNINIINLNNKLSKYYLKYLKLIDKFNIFMELFRNYYLLNTTEGKRDKLDKIEFLMKTYFNLSNRKLIKFIFDNKLIFRLNIPCFMLTLYKNHLLNDKIIFHIKKILLVINNYNDLKLDFIFSLNDLYDNLIDKNININHREILLLFIIYYSLIIYVKNNKLFIPNCFISYSSYSNFLSELFNKKIIIKKINNIFDIDYYDENNNENNDDNIIFYDSNLQSDISLITILKNFDNLNK